MHPYMGQALAAERVADWQRRVAQARRAKQARRTKRGLVEVSPGPLADRDPARDFGQAPPDRIRGAGTAGGDERHPVGAGRA